MDQQQSRTLLDAGEYRIRRNRENNSFPKEAAIRVVDLMGDLSV
jgi:hypothetical protein